MVDFYLIVLTICLINLLPVECLLVAFLEWRRSTLASKSEVVGQRHLSLGLKVASDQAVFIHGEKVLSLTRAKFATI